MDRSRRIPSFLFATLALVAGCEEGASTRDLVVTRAIPSDDGTWIWVGQVEQFGSGGTGDSGIGVDAGVDGGVDIPPGDAWIARITAERNERWQLAVGAMGTLETAESAIELRDQRIAIAGSATTTMDTDAWLLFLESRGAISAQKLLGGPGDQRFVELTALDNGDIALIGLATAADGATPGILMARFTAEGALVWQRLMAMPSATRAVPIQVLRRDDDRLIFLGAVDRPSDGRGLDVWAAATDLDGNLEWQRTLGTTGDDAPGHAIFASDRGLVFAGRVAPTSDPPDPSAPLTGDLWVAKVDAGGSVAWQRYFERVGSEEIPRRVVLREDGRVNVVATSDGFGSRAMGDDDVWVIELGADGEVLSQRVIASLSPDRPVNAIEVDADTLAITGVVDERPAYWTLEDGGALAQGCGNVSDTDARVIETSIQVQDGFGVVETPTFAVTDSTSSEGRPPPLRALECRTAR